MLIPPPRPFIYLFLSVLLPGILFGIACTPKKFASDITAQIMANGAASFEMESDTEVAQQTGLSMIKALEVFQYDNPKNKTLNILLARSYANYTKLFIEWQAMQAEGRDAEKYQKNLQRAKNFYTRGKEFGMNALTTNARFRRALNQDLTIFKKSLKVFDRGDVPALFWTAICWAGLIQLSKDSPQSLMEYPKVEAMMERVLKLDEYYFFAGPHLFFGYAYGSRPSQLGGDAVKSKMHFEKALEAYQRKFLLGHIFYAQSYAVQAQQPQLFSELLNEVLIAEPGNLPQQRLGNEMAQLMAQWLKANKRKFFN